MANNYEQFSEIIECHTAFQREWLLNRLSKIEEENEDILLCMYPPEGETKIWLYNEEWSDTEALATILRDYLRNFNLDDHIIISVAYTCSKPRVGEFGGYAMGITKDEIEIIHARSAIEELLTNGDR